jgi:hypothetical protein
MNPSSSIKSQVPNRELNPYLWLSRQVCLAFLIFANLQCVDSFAASVRQITVNEMMSASELVFEGQVVDVVSKLDMDGRQIHTFVTFQISDLIKGNYAQPKIELSFLGGSVGGLTLEISDMHLPVLEEKGIYFVETLQHRQVNPLYGWDQGHFVIKADEDGVPRVSTRNQLRIVGIGSAGPRRIQALREGVAKGVVISEDSRDKGMSLNEFKLRLREIHRGQP